MVDDTNETILYGSLSYETHFLFPRSELKETLFPCRYCLGQVNLKQVLLKDSSEWKKGN
jgi:hypothetical protein